MGLKEAPLLKRLRNIREGFKPLYRLEYTERHTIRESLMRERYITNGEIWFNLIKDMDFITKADVRRITDIYQTYLGVFPDDEPTVTTILGFASGDASKHFKEKAQELFSDPFYNKVCFNYRRGLDADERFWEDSQMHSRGERFGSLISKTDEEYWNVGEMIEHDLSSIMGRISKSKEARPKDSAVDAIIDPESIGSESIFSLKGASYSNYDSDLKNYYTNKVIPLLECDEVIVTPEPSRWHKYSPPPRVRYSFSNQVVPVKLKPISEELEALI